MNENHSSPTPSTTTTQLYVGGMACAFCAATIEKGLRQVKGVNSSKVLMQSGEVFIKHDPNTVDKKSLKTELQRLGYYVFEGRENMSSLILADSKRRSLAVWLFAAISFAVAFPLMFPGVLPSVLVPANYGLLATSANLILATTVFFYYAMPIHRGAVNALRRRILNEHVLYGAAGFSAYLLGLISFFIPEFRPFFFIAILLTGLHLTAGWFGAKLRFDVERSVKKLMDLRPPMARVMQDGKENMVTVSEVRVGQSIRVKPGERIPLDGTVIEGKSEVSEAILTGESTPVSKQAGDGVLGGSTNGSGLLAIKTSSDFSGSYISRILGLVQSAKQTRSTILTFFDKIVDHIWVPLVLTLAFAALAVWTALGFLARDPAYWETGAVAALLVAVIGYPCAIGFSGPSVGLSVFSEYAENGILVKDTNMFERLKDVSTVIFDKTGTLTYGNPKVVATIIAQGIPGGEDALLRFAYSLENESTHPIARAIVDEAERQGIPLATPESFREVSGAGSVGVVDGRQVFVGKPEFLTENGFSEKEIAQLLSSFSDAGAMSPVVVGVDDRAIGAFDVADFLRPDAQSVVERLRRMGLELLMVTGDSQKAAQEISQRLGGIKWLARKSPKDKIQVIEEYKEKATRQKRGGKVLMVGDGLNDAAALATADIAVATAASLDISKDVADAVLVSSDNLGGILALIENSKTTSRASASNVLLALSFNAVGIPLAVLGVLSASTAMVIMVLSLLGVFSNAYITKFRLGERLARIALPPRLD